MFLLIGLFPNHTSHDNYVLLSLQGLPNRKVGTTSMNLNQLLLRLDLESNRMHAEKTEMELCNEKKCTTELDDALQRAMYGHVMMVEHCVEL